jgi:hypothetical protein
LLHLFLAPHTAAFSAVMGTRKIMAKKLLVQAESDGYKRGLDERKTALETTRGT